MTSVLPVAASAGAGVAGSSAPKPAAAREAGFAQALASAAPAGPLHQASRSGELKPEQAFESMVLRSFIEEMLPKENTAVFGTGTAGGIWRSMLAERIADQMASSGGVGIAEMIARDAKPAG